MLNALMVGSGHKVAQITNKVQHGILDPTCWIEHQPDRVSSKDDVNYAVPISETCLKTNIGGKLRLVHLIAVQGV